MEKKKLILIVSITILSLAITGCGTKTSEDAKQISEDLATMEALGTSIAEQTGNENIQDEELDPLPQNTNTPSQDPFDIKIVVVDDDGNPIEDIEVAWFTNNESDSFLSNNEGSVHFEFKNLPEDQIDIQAVGQGFLNFESVFQVSRGMNEFDIIMTKNPYQSIPSELCQKGQDLLYQEDFEGSSARGWYNIEDAEWSFNFIEDRGTVLTIYMPEGDVRFFYLDFFGDSVWYFDVKYGTTYLPFSILWHFNHPNLSNDTGMYQIQNAQGWLQIHYWDEEDNEHFSGGLVESEKPLPDYVPGNWQRYAVSYYDGWVEVWIDDEYIAGAQHTENNLAGIGPIESGGFGFTLADYPEPVSLDNIYVCSLDDRYEPSIE